MWQDAVLMLFILHIAVTWGLWFDYSHDFHYFSFTQLRPRNIAICPFPVEWHRVQSLICEEVPSLLHTRWCSIMSHFPSLYHAHKRIGHQLNNNHDNDDDDHKTLFSCVMNLQWETEQHFAKFFSIQTTSPDSVSAYQWGHSTMKQNIGCLQHLW